jgi:hypothetical protein
MSIKDVSQKFTFDPELLALKFLITRNSLFLQVRVEFICAAVIINKLVRGNVGRETIHFETIPAVRPVDRMSYGCWCASTFPVAGAKVHALGCWHVSMMEVGSVVSFTNQFDRSLALIVYTKWLETDHFELVI